MYRIRRCIICNKRVNIHKKGIKYEIRNPCEHMDAENKLFTEKQIQSITKGVTPEPMPPEPKYWR